jgi:TolB protein
MSGGRFAVGIAALFAAWAVAAPAQATPPGENGKIFFVGSAVVNGIPNGIPDVWSVNPDGTELVNLTDLPGGPGEGSDPSVSADGTRVAFTVGSQATSDVWIMNADGSNPTQLTFPAADPKQSLDQMPALSPDGSKIAFMTTRSTDPGAMFCCEYDIWLMNSDGTNPVALMEGTGESYNPDFTPDGQRVVASTEMTGDLGIGSAPIVGGPFTGATTTVEVDEDSPITERVPSVSPDGNRIAYVRTNGTENDIYTADRGGANKVPITQTQTDNEFTPDYSPDGTKLAYYRPVDDGEIAITNVDGTGAAALPLDPDVVMFEGSPDWAPRVAVEPPPADTTPPETTITKGPKKKSAKRKAKVFFESNEPNSTFECQLDRKAFAPCASPQKYKRLKAKRHKISVRATDAAGNVDQTPAQARFKVKKKKKR